MTETELVDEGVRLLREYLASGRNRTDLLKDIAEVIVELRSQCSLGDGRTDWGGRSTRYRYLMSGIYSSAGVVAKERDTLQAVLRYHVGNLLRERAPQDDLESVGLMLVSPKERLNNRRQLVTALAAAGGKVDGSDPVRILSYAEALLDVVDDVAVKGLGGGVAVGVALMLDGLEERVRVLRDLLND